MPSVSFNITITHGAKTDTEVDVSFGGNDKPLKFKEGCGEIISKHDLSYSIVRVVHFMLMQKFNGSSFGMRGFDADAAYESSLHCLRCKNKHDGRGVYCDNCCGAIVGELLHGDH